MSKYQNLDAWKISMQLVKQIYLLTKNCSKEEIYALTSQSKRAAVSVPANIAMGMRRNYKKDTLQFLQISRGSLHELEILLNTAGIVEIIKEQDFIKILPLLDQSLQVLNGLINYIDKTNLK